MHVLGRYRYFAVELFHATLEQFCSRQYHTGRMPSDAKVLCQIANGIDFLHRKGLAHGQLNPNTILIAQSNPAQIKVSEFGLSRRIRSQTDENRVSEPNSRPKGIQEETSHHGLVQQSTSKDTQDTEFLPASTKSRSKDDSHEELISHPACWMLPGSWSSDADEDGREIISSSPTVHGDEFAAGCILFYFLTRGSHPFGRSSAKASSILENVAKMDPVNLKSITFQLFILNAALFIPVTALQANDKFQLTFGLIAELDSNHFAFECIKDLIGKPPTDGTQRLRKAADQLSDVLPREQKQNKKINNKISIICSFNCLVICFFIFFLTIFQSKLTN